MPSAVRYVPPTEKERQTFNSIVATEKQTRRKQYRQALEYYKGEHPDQLETDKDDPDDNVVINLTKMTAERTATFLFSEVPKFITDPASIEDTEPETYLKDFFEDNGGLLTLTKLTIRGFLAGHNFVRVKPSRKTGKRQIKPKFVVLDPTAVAVFWKADDVGDVLWYELRYNVGVEVFIQDFVYLEELDEWVIYTYKGKPIRNTVADIVDVDTPHGMAKGLGVSYVALDRINFEQYNWEEVEKANHTHYIPPIIDFPHLPDPDDYYGLTEHTQKDLQDTINRVASAINRIVRENADPLDVVTGTDPDEIEKRGSLLTIPNATARAYRFELKGDMDGIHKTFDKLMEVYLATVRVVLLKGEAKDLQRVTNASVRTLFLDALAKNAILQASYGHALRKVCKLVLMMAYAEKQIDTNPENLKITIQFPEPLPTDMTEVANISAIMSNLGQSDRTSNTNIGNDWAFEKANKDAEYKDSMKKQEAAMVMQRKFAPNPEEDNSSPATKSSPVEKEN